MDFQKVEKDCSEGTLTPSGSEGSLTPNSSRGSLKHCKGCNKIYNIEKDFYICKGVIQVLCKSCHNKNRVRNARIKREEELKANPPPEENEKKPRYIKKVKGFDKLPKDLQEKISFDIFVNKTFMNIYTSYVKEYPDLNYQTLVYWSKSGKIPKYNGEMPEISTLNIKTRKKKQP